MPRTEYTLTRSKGLGKFEGEFLITELAWEIGLDGVDEEFSGEGWWFGRLDDLDESLFTEDSRLSDYDLNTIRSYFGVILHEDSSGFIYGQWFHTKEAIDAEWDHMLGMYEQEEEDE